MLINRQTWPMHVRWIALVIVATIAAVGGYLFDAHQSSPDRWPGGSSPIGLVLGVAAAAIILFELLLWPRKWPRVRAWRIGRTQVWMRAHIWLGLLSAPLVVLHHGLSWEWGGGLTFVMMLLYWAVIVSGVVGLYLQQVLPSYMLHALPAESIVSQLPHLARQMVDDAERLIAEASGMRVAETGTDAAHRSAAPREGSSHVVVGAVRSIGHVRGKVLETQPLATTHLDRRDSGAVIAAFRQSIQPYLLAGEKAGSTLHKSTQAATFFAGLRARLSGDAMAIVDTLEEFCNSRRQFDVQVRVHRLLHGWLCIHLPLSIALVVLLAGHIFSAIRYAGIWPL